MMTKVHGGIQEGKRVDVSILFFPNLADNISERFIPSAEVVHHHFGTRRQLICEKECRATPLNRQCLRALDELAALQVGSDHLDWQLDFCGSQYHLLGHRSIPISDSRRISLELSAN